MLYFIEVEIQAATLYSEKQTKEQIEEHKISKELFSR